MADVNKLKLSRRNIKGQLTRTLSTIDSLTTDAVGDLDMLKKYITKAEQQFEKVEEKHSALMDIIEDQREYEVEEKWMGECENEYVQVLIRGRRVVDRQSQSPLDNQQFLPSSPTIPHPRSSPASYAPSPMPHTATSAAPRMARMRFPTFNGNLRDYKRFKELFTHCATELTEMECFHQLTESMINVKERDKIKGCISVERAWQVLDECYGDQDKVVDSLLKDLENLRTYEIKGKTNLPAMGHFVQTLQNFETQAETIGLSGELNSKIMLSQIKQKLPEEHCIAYYKGVRDDRIDDSLTGLVKWLYSQLLLLEKAKPNSGDNSPSPPQRQHKVYKSTSAASYTSDNQSQPSKARHSGVTKCAIHPNADSHYLKTCNKFKSLPQNEKYKVMRKNGICYRCGHNNCVAGKPPHDQNSCQFVAPCRVQTCGSDSHFAAVCPVIYGESGQGPANQTRNTMESPRSTSINVTTAHTNETGKLQSTLPTVVGYLRCGDVRHLVRILLDGGSQATLLREGILPRTERGLFQDHDLSLVGGSKITRKLRLLDCYIEDIAGNWSCPLTMTEINQPCGDTPIVLPEQLRQYEHLSAIDIHAAPSETIDVLLGVDNTHLMIWEEYILGEKFDDPVAVRCPFGWFVQGGRSTSSTSLLNYINVSAIGPLEEFIGLETVGLEPKKCKCSSDVLDKEATEAMQRSVTQLSDGSYEVRLPWRKSPDDLPDNYNYAVKRLRSLENQFKNRHEDWDIYCRQMRDQLKRGVSRHVSEEELQRDRSTGKKMWFLPHFAVTKDSKTTPVRVVYDAKARFQGHSLNDYLMKGENINSDLFEVALRFRENEVGIIADVSKMYQAIKIKSDDARFHRFVFRENSSHPIQVYELTTVTFGDKPSPTAAIVTLRHVVDEHAPEDDKLKEVVARQFYVDDLNESVTNVPEALELKSKLSKTLQKGNFTIRKWQSNATEACDETEDSTDATALGTKWNLSKDTLRVKEVKSTLLVPTKRNILAQTASYYDVFGMLSGLLVRPKILLQKLWQLNLDWDTPLNDKGELCAILRDINRDLEEVASIEIPRCLIPEPFKGIRPLPEVSLHGASDASEDAMGIGVWLRWSHPEDTEAHLSFVCAKAKLTPLKQSSIPRKELQAILLLSRLMLTVKKALRLNIAYSKIWTDSMTAISWVRGQSKSFRSYVAYRVGEITTEFDPIKDIAYVPSDQNVIDLVSRGGTANEMRRVIEGPVYLKQSPTFWPKTPENVPVSLGDEEQKKFHVRNAKTLALRINVVSKPSPIVDSTKFSSWCRLKMVTARVLSVKKLPKNQWLKQLAKQISMYPSPKLVKEAELYWLRQAQRDVDFQDPNIMKLDPFFDEEDQVFRVGGRIDRAPLSYDVRHPYLLPKKSHISLLIVRDRHAHALHGGHLRTATEVRKRYWIVGDVNISKRVVYDCVVCRRHRGKPIQQKMADLPEFRVTPCSPPFKTTLVDYLGPVNVKLNRNTTTKGYCAVFTCAVTRAVHLTCVQDLSTQAFLQALERFISIRGAPSLLVSDNGTAFRGADNTINELNLKLNQTVLKDHCQRYNVQWKFGPPGGPHHQGAVERLVQEVKKGMRHLVKADRLTFVEWETVFCQISSLINGRPLTAKSSSPLDHPPLTPNHFLIGRGDLPCPEVPCEEYKGNHRKRREICNFMVDGFWRRWMECIHKLSPRQKWQKSAENLGERDIVLVIGENLKRGSWKMAEVTCVYPGKDDLVRVVDVRFADGTKLKRPVTKLVLLMKESERS
ncbi:uncharacterized protein LOC135155912 [Lytechinus pictus]|uniref:uncharacterized protein LOC135155912 n=1 Tax=Lytechinus pictus TaxID=7653 RepID=UPI0030B9E5F4